MKVTFNADDIFAMAEQIERNGAKFYRMAANKMTAPESKELLTSLAAWEERHERMFTRMRAGLTDEEKSGNACDPRENTERNFQAFTDGLTSNLREDPVKTLGRKKSLAQIVEKAIEMEKDSVIFYLGLAKIVPARLGKTRVNNVIREEMKHMQILHSRIPARKD